MGWFHLFQIWMSRLATEGSLEAPGCKNLDDLNRPHSTEPGLSLKAIHQQDTWFLVPGHCTQIP